MLFGLSLTDDNDLYLSNIDSASLTQLTSILVQSVVPVYNNGNNHTNNETGDLRDAVLQALYRISDLSLSAKATIAKQPNFLSCLVGILLRVDNIVSFF